MKNLVIALGCLLTLSACQSGENKVAAETKTATPYTVPDDAAITQAVHDAYTAISFKKGEQPRFDEIKNYFIPQTQMINFRADTAGFTNLPAFVNLYKQFVNTNHIRLFYEEELYGKNEQFGKIAHRISTYKTYLNTMDTIAERGVNSFQLIKTPRGWKVSSIIWDVEKPTLKVPAYYLK
ncbi:hypothetical protein [Mucilaginibacter phyllosphaerae]|uniref:Nuclear transport factor 2 family protein n=1 Tax=Mucilaginibacter phyllosphaerae TaxID=1812349 RepID=A0A4Y8ALQ8_9SPHI|nr:hypothetical protein [Mucilaginibacter phyllosphaerae]MBB3967602.1 hypothetical protein [Mucilaginibacter phyllosphaerae]TEW69341.1 hypothetical protein E2R65_04005 [Mucilaginibacter phyllosphaerae]GGH21636.1 hypothetical protein GCM10007352_34510 [Mucilaginibacter phyllosphaerae]